jgi:hypothetical protein
MGLLTCGLATSTVDGLYGPFDAFDPRLALVAFCTNVLLQAIFLKPVLELSWIRAAVYTILINGLVYLTLSYFCPVWPYVTWHYGDNPLVFALQNLTLFAIGDLIMLTVIWWRAPATPKPFVAVLRQMSIGQLVWVPVSFALLMLPAHPFPGLERADGYKRWSKLVSRLKGEPLRTGQFSSAEEFVRKLGLPEEVAHQPSYPRFATRDVGQVSMKVNVALSDFEPGKRQGIEWLLDIPYAPGEHFRRAYVDLKTGVVTFFNPEDMDRP